MTNKSYDILKDIALCWFPLFMTFVGVVMTAWNIPYTGPVTATLAGINAFLGGLVKYYKTKYDEEQEEKNGSEGN